MTKRERYKISIAVFLFLIQENKILLIKRSNTGWMDGFYSVPAGSIDGDETLVRSIMREAKEEVNVDVKEADLHLVHTLHCLTHGEEWMGVFFIANKWKGEPTVNEPHKHSEVKWVNIHVLPGNIIPYVKQAIESYLNKSIYSEYQN